MKKRIFGINHSKQITQAALQTGLASPTTDMQQLNHQNENNLVQAINRKISNFMENNKIRKFTQKFKVERGRNNAVKYQKFFQFKQQWELTDKSIFTLHYNYFFPQNFLFRLLNLLMLFLQITLVWILSVFRLFQYEDNIWIFSYSLIISILDSLLKSFFIFYFISDQKIKSQHKIIQKKKYFHNYIGNIFCLFYSILGLSCSNDNVSNQAFLFFDIFCILFVYLRCQQIYQHFKIALICSKYKAYMKIFDLMSNLFILTHVFGLLIFAVSRFNPVQTYLSYAQLKGPLNWFEKYIYSIYFSSTTMLTVGYGDLLPANIQQIAVVLIMQLFGIVMIGYINGQVGDVLCTLRRERENLQNDLTNSEKLSKSYKLSNQTSQKIREHLIDNRRRVDEELNIQEQNNLLGKISDQLRLQANYTNHINLIKENIFFVYNFSKKIQIQLSNKLIKCVFSPNQNLTQIIGKQKIYLLSKGQIAIYISKKNKRAKNGRKILRVLSKNNQKQMHQNSFGHTALILGRPTQLKAFSKDFVICHTLQRHDFLQALSLDTNDLESFHQMRAKYEISKHPQKEQAPQFNSIRQHYCPNHSFLIKKYLKRNHHTKRKQWIRNRQKCRAILQKFTQDQQNQIYNHSIISDECSSIESVIEPQKIKNQKCLSEKQRQNKYKNQSNNALAKLNIRSRGYLQKYGNKKYQQKKAQIVSKFTSKQFEEPFEVYKEYQSFLKHGNVSNMIKKFLYQHNLMSFVSSFIQVAPSFQEPNFNETPIQAKIFRHRRMLKSLPF